MNNCLKKTLFSCLISLSISATEIPKQEELKKESTIKTVYYDHVEPTLVDGFDRMGWMILAVGTGATVIAKQYDKKMQRYFLSHDPLPWKVSQFGNSLGATFIMPAVAFLQLLYDRNNGLAHFEVLSASFLVSTFSKTVVKRNRPDGSERNSFPSGHTTTVFSSAGSVSYAYGIKAAIPSYLLATTTAMARMEYNKHWFSDLIAGMTIGVFWARSSGFHHGILTPVVERNKVGMTWQNTF